MSAGNFSKCWEITSAAKRTLYVMGKMKEMSLLVGGGATWIGMSNFQLHTSTEPQECWYINNKHNVRLKANASGSWTALHWCCTASGRRIRTYPVMIKPTSLNLVSFWNPRIRLPVLPSPSAQMSTSSASQAREQETTCSLFNGFSFTQSGRVA